MEAGNDHHQHDDFHDNNRNNGRSGSTHNSRAATTQPRKAASSSPHRPSSEASIDTSSNNNDISDEDDHHQRQALREAEAVLEAIGGETQLDGFNLLSVIVNPRGGSLTASAGHAAHPSSSAAASAAASVAASVADQSFESAGVLADTYHTLEVTLSQVTEQMDALNLVLEDWSRQLLEDSSSQEDHVPESLLKELPNELQNLDLDSLQAYLASSGVMAHAFSQRNRASANSSNAKHHSRLRPLDLSHGGDDEDPGLPAKAEGNFSLLDDALGAIISMEELEREIPEQFFRPDFDLTDPDTFRELLLLGGGTGSPGEPAAASPMNTDGPVQEWFPLAPPDTFGGFLDRVELALLQQVRSKSDEFFQESLRFALLQEWIQSLVAQVVQLQAVVDQLHRDLLTPMEVVPRTDDQRKSYLKLLSVLDRASQLLACKHSIAGLLSAQDDMGAIDRIQYGRRLLSGTCTSGSSMDEASHANNVDGSQRPTDDATMDDGVELNRLLAVQSVADQLNQYENLVVTNLREELVEVLLEWNSAAVSSLYASPSVSSGKGSSSAGPANHRHEVKDRVRELLAALARCRGLAKSRDAYSARLHEVIRITVRTIVSEFASEAASSPGDNGGAASSIATSTTSVSSGATAMSLERFLDCLDMMFEQLVSILTSAKGVDEFCVEEGISLQDGSSDDSDSNQPKADAPTPTSPLAEIILSAAELSSKSVSELLRLRKEAHSLVTLEEMKRIWDKCMAFTSQLEDLSGHKASALRSTLLAQAKAFIERKHESNMSALAAALDSERWTQCEVSAERQDALSRLCCGRAAIVPSGSHDGGDAFGDTRKAPEVEIEGKRYKVVWSCLLLMEMVISDLMAASQFSSLASGLVAKVAELLRLFNTRTTHLVLGAGAIHSAARLKSINAKHLSLVAQCLRLVSTTLPHVRASLLSQLPPKQHTLLTVLDQIKKDYADHNEKILNKFVTIIGGIVEHGLAPKLRGTDFDARASAPPSADGNVACCVFFEGISTNTRKMHQVLSSLLPPDHLQDVFSRIFAFVDQKVPSLIVSMAEEKMQAQANPSASAPFRFPSSDEGKHRLLLEVDVTTRNLNSLEGVRPWEFTISTVLSKHLEISPPITTEASPRVNDVTSAAECNGGTAADPHPNEVVSESGTEVTSETLTTTDTAPVDDPHHGNSLPSVDGDEEVPPATEGDDPPPSPPADESSNPHPDGVESTVPDAVDNEPLPASDVTTL